MTSRGRPRPTARHRRAMRRRRSRWVPATGITLDQMWALRALVEAFGAPANIVVISRLLGGLS